MTIEDRQLLIKANVPEELQAQCFIWDDMIFVPPYVEDYETLDQRAHELAQEWSSKAVGEALSLADELANVRSEQSMQSMVINALLFDILPSLLGGV